MTKIKRSIVVFFLTFFMGAGVMADEMQNQLTRSQVDRVLDAKTWYAQAGESQIAIYHEGGKIAAKWPGGDIWRGDYSQNEDGTYCTVWRHTPDQKGCSKLVGTPEEFTIVDLGSGQPRGLVRRIVDGDAEGLSDSM